MIFDGTENWTSRSTSAGLLFELIVDSGLYPTSTKNLGYCNQYISMQELSVQDNTFRIQTTRLSIRDTSISSLADFKAQIVISNLIIYYPLEEPEEVPITDITLISQLNDLYYANSYNDKTNITITSYNLPLNIKIKTLKSN